MRPLILGALLALVGAAAGCPAGHNDYPSASCKTDSDCYKGEKCMNASICIAVAPDMAVTLPPPDFAGVVQDLASTASDLGGD